jgi:hypothetical protein
LINYGANISIKNYLNIDINDLIWISKANTNNIYYSIPIQFKIEELISNFP